jgi:hypothetical protein
MRKKHLSAFHASVSPFPIVNKPKAPSSGALGVIKRPKGKEANMATFNANYKPVKGDTPEDIVRKKYSLHIVPGNPKIGARTANVSLKSGPPKAGGTCMNCANCVKKCYDLKADRAYPEVLTARLENAHLAIHELDLFERAMIEYLSRKKNLQFFRWHVGGDIPSLAYLHMMARIAQSFPHVRFLVFTKHWREKDGLSLETFARPKNLAMLLSRDWRTFDDVLPWHLCDPLVFAYEKS